VRSPSTWIVEHRLVQRDRQHLLARKRTAFSSCCSFAIPAISRTRTPIRLLAMPRRTPWRGSPLLAEEGTENVREQLGLAQLAADDEAVVELGARDLDELGDAVVDDARRGELGGADLEPDEALAPLRAADVGLRFFALGCLPAFSPRLLRLALERKIALQERLLSSSPSSPSARAAPSAAAASASASASGPRA
jgi:hypothetical protein